MMDDKTIEWLLDSDVSIQYQVFRDLLKVERPELQQRISQEGWGAAFLSKRNSDGYRSERYYQPK